MRVAVHLLVLILSARLSGTTHRDRAAFHTCGLCQAPLGRHTARSPLSLLRRSRDRLAAGSFITPARFLSEKVSTRVGVMLPWARQSDGNAPLGAMSDSTLPCSSDAALGLENVQAFVDARDLQAAFLRVARPADAGIAALTARATAGEFATDA